VADAESGPGWAEVVHSLSARRERFHALVADALDALPPAIAARMDNVVILVEDEGEPGTLGLYEGVSQTERDADYMMVAPDVITIYRAPIEARARTPEDLEAEVRRTVWHEIAHHFGITDEQLEDMDRY